MPSKVKNGDTMVLLYSGDGGWGSTEQPFSKELINRGIPVIGLNSTLYFFNPLTPVKTADDAEKLMRYYLNVWNKKNIILIGYSYGADIVPFIMNRLSPDLYTKVKAVVIMAPTKTIEFSVRGNGVFGIVGLPTYPVQDEIKKINTTKIICFYGVDETDTLCKDNNLHLQHNIVIISHTGGHRIDTNYTDLLKELHL
jgi:type IV secretory pathway VirJ component